MATWIEEVRHRLLRSSLTNVHSKLYAQVGFPVIHAEEVGDLLKLRQNRFLATGDLKVRVLTSRYGLALTQVTG